MRQIMAIFAMCGQFVLLHAYETYYPYNDNGYYLDGLYYYDAPASQNGYYYVEGGEASYNPPSQNNYYPAQNSSSNFYFQQEGNKASQPNLQMQQNTQKQASNVQNQNPQFRLMNQSSQERTEKDKKLQERLTSMEKKYPQDRGATLADRELNARIRDKISEGWIWRSYEGIRLNTNNGVVFLDGVVDKNADREKIFIEIRKIDGVRGINNNLQSKDNK